MPAARSPAELERILAAPRRRSGRIALELPGLGDGERRALERKLDRLRRACGCEAGAVAMGVFTACYAAWAALGPDPVAGRLGAVAGTGIAVAAAGAVLGKGAGIAWARLRLRRELRNLAARLARPHPSSRSMVTTSAIPPQK